MIEAWAMQRYGRILLAVGTLTAGFTLAQFFIGRSSFFLAVLILAVSLATLVGVGKLASP